MLAMMYGYEAKGHHDKTIEAAKQLSDIGTRASLPGSLLVNEFPFRTWNLSPYIVQSSYQNPVQYGISQNGYRGSAIGHLHVLAMLWRNKS
jgi:hypothetical protein